MKFLIKCDSPDFCQTYLQEPASAIVVFVNAHLLFLLWFLTLKILNFFGVNNEFNITFGESDTGLDSIYCIAFALLLSILFIPFLFVLNYMDEIPEPELSLNFSEERPTTFFSGKGISGRLSESEFVSAFHARSYEKCELSLRQWLKAQHDDFEKSVEPYRFCKNERINKKSFNSVYWPINDPLGKRSWRSRGSYKPC